MRFWRFFLGAGIGMGLGYALVLLLQPSMARRAKPRFRTIYEAPAERKEEQTAA